MDQQVTDYLNTNAVLLFEDEVLGGAELKLRFNDPLKDSRTPDVIMFAWQYALCGVTASLPRMS